MMNSMTLDRANRSVDAAIPSAVGSSTEISDGAMMLVDRIRVLEGRRMAAFRLSSVGRRRLLLLIHAKAPAAAAEPAGKASRRRS